MSKIKQTARQYDIDPITSSAPSLASTPYNVDAYDRLQSYYVKAAAYAADSFRFGYKGMSVGEFVSKSQFDQCKEFTDSYRLWSCREDVWEKAFRDKTVDGGPIRITASARCSSSRFMPARRLASGS